MSAIKVAIATGQRPTAVIFRDPYALHWKEWDPFWIPDPVKDTVWTDWDYILLEAYQLHHDWTDSESGQWIPFDQSGDVWWEIREVESGALKAVQEHQKDKEEKPGVKIYPVPIFADEESKPTLKQYLREMEESGGNSRRRPAQASGARPPTAEEMAALKAAKEA